MFVWVFRAQLTTWSFVDIQLCSRWPPHGLFHLIWHQYASHALKMARLDLHKCDLIERGNPIKFCDKSNKESPIFFTSKIKHFIARPTRQLEHLIQVSLVVNVAFFEFAHVLPRFRICFYVKFSKWIRVRLEKVGLARITYDQVEQILPIRATQRLHAMVDEPKWRIRY